jgi:hypothetical protein
MRVLLCCDAGASHRGRKPLADGSSPLEVFKETENIGGGDPILPVAVNVNPYKFRGEEVLPKVLDSLCHFVVTGCKLLVHGAQ